MDKATAASLMRVSEAQKARLVLDVQFPCGLAVVAPDWYEPDPFDPPVFTWRELLGLMRVGVTNLAPLYELKAAFPSARATGAKV